MEQQESQLINPKDIKVNESPSPNQSEQNLNPPIAPDINPRTSSLLDHISPGEVDHVIGDKKTFRVLSIDGGGVRGIIPTMILSYIEKKTGKPISQLFDVITGTSTGALLGVMLNIPKSEEDKTPRFNTDDALDLYMEECPKIFKPSFLDSLKACWGLNGPRFSAKVKRKVIEKYTGDYKITDCLSDIIIPTFDIKAGTPYFFKSKNARLDPRCDYKLADVLDATSSAPTYFTPCKVKGHDEDEKRGYRCFVDGALTANCPALCTLVDSIKLYGRTPDQIVIVSLGCGAGDIGVNYESASDWGALSWATYFPSALINGSMDTVGYQIDDLLEDRNYFRFQKDLPPKNVNIDDASKKNLQFLKEAGQQLVNDNKDKLDEVCDILVNGL